MCQSECEDLKKACANNSCQPWLLSQHNPVDYIFLIDFWNIFFIYLQYIFIYFFYLSTVHCALIPERSSHYMSKPSILRKRKNHARISIVPMCQNVIHIAEKLKFFRGFVLPTKIWLAIRCRCPVFFSKLYVLHVM